MLSEIVESTETILVLGAENYEINSVLPYYGEVIGLNNDPLKLIEMKNCNTLLADFNSEIPLDSGTVDTVMSSNIFDFVNDPVNFFEEIYRILMPGGRSMHMDVGYLHYNNSVYQSEGVRLIMEDIEKMTDFSSYAKYVGLDVKFSSRKLGVLFLGK